MLAFPVRGINVSPSKRVYLDKIEKCDGAMQVKQLVYDKDAIVETLVLKFELSFESRAIHFKTIVLQFSHDRLSLHLVT